MTLVDPSSRSIGAFDVGPLAFGCSRFLHDSVGEARRVLDTALEVGMNLVDTADVYGTDAHGEGFGACEELLGRVLRSAPQLREKMVLATKGGVRPPTPYDSSPAALRAACEASLRRLDVETIDLYQIHRPDVFAHPHDVADTLVVLRDEGKVRELGVSNHTPAQTAALADALRERGATLAATQPELSVAELRSVRDGTLDQAMEFGLATLGWSPLGGGRVLTGQDLRAELPAALDRLAERENVDRATIAVAFVLTLPSRPVAILGTQNPARLWGATRALTVNLDRADCYEIIAASEGVAHR